MDKSKSGKKATLEELLDKLESLENRVGLLENAFQKGLFTSVSDQPFVEDVQVETEEAEEQEESPTIESRIGEYGLAWAGSIVLLFAIVFLMNYLNSLGHRISGSLIGYLGTALVFALSYFLRNSFPSMVRVLSISGYILLYYVTLLLHFFVEDPLIGSTGISFVLILLPVVAIFIYSQKRNSEFIGVLGLIMLILTAIFTDSTNLTLSLLLVAAGISTWQLYDKGWWKMFFLAMVLVYTGHVIWLFGNPVMGHPAVAVTTHQYNLVFLFAYGIFFSSTALIKDRERLSEEMYNIIILWNGLSFSLVLLGVILAMFKDNYVPVFVVITILCLAYAVIIERKIGSKFVPSIFAVYGFMALSAVVYGLTAFPITFLYLGIQSFLVLSLALWFRSKTIVIVNLLMYFGLLAIYLIGGDMRNGDDFSFALVALSSARFINWQRERLDIQTEFIRNIYLFLTFVTFLIALYFAVPAQYVSLTWGLLAVLFFVFSFVLKNVKYRYIAFGVIFATVIHLFFVDMANMSLGLRVVAFLVVAVISLGLSVYYARNRNKQIQKESD